MKNKEKKILTKMPPKQCTVSNDSEAEVRSRPTIRIQHVRSLYEFTGYGIHLCSQLGGLGSIRQKQFGPHQQA